MGDRVLFTDKREEILDGKYNKKDAADRNAKSRFHSSIQTALYELTKIAQNPEIDNSRVFETDQVEAFISALYTGNNFTPYRNFDGDVEAYRNHISYQLDLHARLERINSEFAKLAHEDPEAGTGLIPPEGYEGLRDR